MTGFARHRAGGLVRGQGEKALWHGPVIARQLKAGRRGLPDPLPERMKRGGRAKVLNTIWPGASAISVPAFCRVGFPANPRELRWELRRSGRHPLPGAGHLRKTWRKREQRNPPPFFLRSESKPLPFLCPLTIGKEKADAYGGRIFRSLQETNGVDFDFITSKTHTAASPDQRRIGPATGWKS